MKYIYRDSRGLAYAFVRKYKEVIEDFQVFIDGANKVAESQTDQ